MHIRLSDLETQLKDSTDTRAAPANLELSDTEMFLSLLKVSPIVICHRLT
jgi:hypothetical protein